MEKLKKIPVYQRFGFMVLLFNALLVAAMVLPSRLIGKQDYKNLTDRLAVHGAVFDYWYWKFDSLRREDWKEEAKSLPGILPGQRVLLISADGKIEEDFRMQPVTYFGQSFKAFLPDPYIDPDTEAFADAEALPRLIAEHPEWGEMDFMRRNTFMLNVREKDGLNRLIVAARAFQARDGDWYLLAMVSSVVDILLQDRAIKERILIRYAILAAMGILLTVLLTRSVTAPFRRLYRYAGDILQGARDPEKRLRPRETGEIGIICSALGRQIDDQQKQGERFRRFSSDVVHELKTPLSAIRSGLEIYAESDDQKERESVYARINRRISQMEELMNEIEQLAVLETSGNGSKCADAGPLFDDLAVEYAGAGVIFDGIHNIREVALPLPEEKLRQVLTNILDNALSFSPEPGSVTLSVQKDDAAVRITIRDSGPGIAPEASPFLTDRFYSFRPEGSAGHSGLGLSIVSAILGGCGGSLSFRNVPDGGAEFTMVLPLV